MYQYNEYSNKIWSVFLLLQEKWEVLTPVVSDWRVIV